MINVLILGAGGREHALAWKLAQSPLLGHLFIAPGNAGTAAHGTNIDLGTDSFNELKTFMLDKQINMLVVGPEAPLVNGIHDQVKADDQLRHINVIGPLKAAAMLEGSKDFAKDFMNKYGIPTAAHATFNADQLNEGLAFLKAMHAPFVLKADG